MKAAKHGLKNLLKTYGKDIPKERHEAVIDEWNYYGKSLKIWAESNNNTAFLNSIDRAFVTLLNTLWWKKTEIKDDPELGKIAAALAIEGITAEWMRDDVYHLGKSRPQIETLAVGPLVSGTLSVMRSLGHKTSSMRYAEVDRIGDLLEKLDIAQKTGGVVP